jgi:hypothetical protein
MYGIAIDTITEDMKNKIKESFGNNDEEFDDDISFSDLSDFLDDKVCNDEELKQCYLSTYSSPYDDILYIGKSFSQMKDDQTLLEFKKEIINALEKLGLPTNIEYIEECWYDG